MHHLQNTIIQFFYLEAEMEITQFTNFECFDTKSPKAKEKCRRKYLLVEYYQSLQLSIKSYISHGLFVLYNLKNSIFNQDKMYILKICIIYGMVFEYRLFQINNVCF